MTYYILLETEKKENLIFDANILGEVSFNIFYPNKGFARFIKIVNDYPDTISTIRIFDETDKNYTVHQFLNVIEKTKISKNTN